MTNVRVAAAQVVLAVDAGRTTLAAELDAAQATLADRRDRALLVEIATGVFRHRSALDVLVARAARRRSANIEPVALAVLRVGAYQIIHLDRVPSHAIVHESVETVRTLGAPRAAGFVNAVLRSLTRRVPIEALPARPRHQGAEGAELAYLATSLSHPRWLIERWHRRYGFEATERWCLFNNATPDATVRSLGRLSAGDLADRLRAEGIEPVPAPFVPDALRLPAGTLGRISSLVRDELFVQDEAAQIVARVADVKPGERVLDVCAAPGGKTLVMAADLHLRDQQTSSRLVAADHRALRVALLTRTLERAALHVPVVALDALRPLPFGAVFDCVLLDAPCSGLGTLGRDPDLRWSRREGDLAPLAAAEARMIASAAAVVRPGGRLIYATRSSEPEENIDVVRAFLDRDPGFRLDPLPAAFLGRRDLVDRHGCLTTLPFRHELDAFFAAILVRQAAA